MQGRSDQVYLSIHATSALVVAACLAAGCGDDLPNDKGHVWECHGEAFDEDPDGNPFLLALVGPGAVRITQCANPDVSEQAVTAACVDECEKRFRAWGLFPEFPFFYRDIAGCKIHTVVDTGRPCEDSSVEMFNGGPANARISLNQSSSIVTLNVDGNVGQGNVFGTIDITIDPLCSASSCQLYISRLDLGTTSFDINGNNVHGVNVQSHGGISGLWQSDTSYELPENSVAVSVVFSIDDNSGSTTLVNSLNKLHGNLSADYSTFTLSGDFSDGDKASVHLELVGHAVALPPVAHFSPKGVIECDSPPGLAHVTLDSSDSFDPDGDLAHRAWHVDGTTEGWDQVLLPKTFSLGPHSVALNVVDSRGGLSEESGTITVVDTTPPELELSLTPSCLWPPNHKFVLYSFGDGIDAEAEDVCDANPAIRVVDVVSDQPSLGGGSGNTDPDIAFGTGAFCVRAERAGTLQTDRIYTVTVESADFVGNTTQKQVTVRVPHNLGHGDRADCPNIDPARVVEDDDPRCTEAIGPPIPVNEGAIAMPNAIEPPKLEGTSAAASGGCSISDPFSLGSSSPHALLWWLVGAAMFFGRGSRRVGTVASCALLSCALLAGCNGDGVSASIADGPLSGMVGETDLHIEGMLGKWSKDESRVTIGLSSYPNECGAPAPTPANGQTLTEIAISVPRTKLKPGVHDVSLDLSRDSTSVGVGVTSYWLDDAGRIQQRTLLARDGVVRIDEVDASGISGGLAVEQADASLSGLFDAPICP